MRKIQSLLILLVLLSLVLPWQAASAETVAGGQLTDTITWDFQDGVLTISGEGGMEYATISGAPWYYLRQEITTVIVEEGILGIDYHAFENCVNLTRVQLPSTLRSIRYDAFFNCQSLSEITLPPNLKYIGSSAFRYCISLKSITIPDSVESLEGSVFQNCYNLESVILSEKLVEIRPYTFHGCSSLTAITLPQSIEKIGAYAFKDCESLRKVTFSEELWYMEDGAFQGCASLKNLEFPASFRYFEDEVFHDCDNLTQLRFLGDLPSVGENVFDQRDPGEDPCVISYPAENKTWSKEKRELWQKLFPGVIRFEAYGELECDHDVVIVPGVEATCTEEGMTEKHYCAICKKVLKKQSVVDPLGHDFVVTTVAPTCTEPGYDLHICSRCQLEERHNEVEAHGHSFGPWETVKEPTVEEEGQQKRQCLNCAAGEERSLEKLPPPPTQPPTQMPTQPTAPTPPATDPAPTRPNSPAPRERIEAGLLMALILLGVAGAILGVRILTKKKL